MTRTALIATFAIGLATATVPAAAQTVIYQPAPDDGAPPPAVSGVVVQGRAVRDGEELVSETVSYADLDVSSHEGARTLFRRLRHAADNVCSESWSGAIHDDPAQRGCAESALIRAMYRSRIPGLVYVYESGRY